MAGESRGGVGEKQGGRKKAQMVTPMSHRSETFSVFLFLGFVFVFYFFLETQVTFQHCSLLNLSQPLSEVQKRMAHLSSNC